MTTPTPFPDCIMNVLETNLKTIEGVTVVHQRELEPNDSNGDVGVSMDSWHPLEYEIGGIGSSLGAYVLVIEHLVKHSNRESGWVEHRNVARSIRSMLAVNADVRVALGALVHVSTDPSYTERMMKWTLEQRNASNQINRDFYFVSGTTVTFETEVI